MIVKTTFTIYWHICEKKAFLFKCSLELAEDVSIFCRDAGGLQNSYPKGKKFTNPEVLQHCFKWSIKTCLQWILMTIYTSCNECI